MKTQQIMTIVLVASVAALSQTNAGEKHLSKQKVPKAVLGAFEKSYPNAKAMKFEKEQFENQTAYEVKYKDNGKQGEVLYDEDGAVLQNEEGIDVSALPEEVVKAVKKAHPKAKIKEAEKLTKPDGSLTGYEVEIKAGKKELEIELDTDGKILRTE